MAENLDYIPALPPRVGTALLDDLLPHAPYLHVVDGRIKVLKKFDVPLDEYGIPIREQLLSVAIGTVAAGHSWIGKLDIHHVAWPMNQYKHGGCHIDPMYRCAAKMKVVTPRQLHDYLHIVSEPPPLPAHDVMAQFVREEVAINKLERILKLRYGETEGAINQADNSERLSKFKQTLDATPPSQIGHLPSHEMLHSLDAATARKVLLAKITVLDARLHI